jgi:hypothetical protein
VRKLYARKLYATKFYARKLIMMYDLETFIILHTTIIIHQYPYYLSQLRAIVEDILKNKVVPKIREFLPSSFQKSVDVGSCTLGESPLKIDGIETVSRKVEQTGENLFN